MADRPSAPTRRQFVAATATATVGTLAGCATGSAGPGQSGAAVGGDTEPVSLLVAGSLQLALAEGLVPRLDVPLEIESHGSATVARLVATGRRTPDIVSVADTALFESILQPAWYAVFASNAIVLAYNPESAGGQRVADAGTEVWYRPLLDGDVSLGRTDPDMDPLGYRTLFTLELATRYYDDAPPLHETLPTRRQIYPETSLLSRFETGALDAAFVYRNMAIERDYDYLELPAEIDLGDPAHAADWYRTVDYKLPDGTTVGGDLISYGSTVRTDREAVNTVFDQHVDGNYLADHGFLTPASLPRYEGDVPEEIRG